MNLPAQYREGVERYMGNVANMIAGIPGAVVIDSVRDQQERVAGMTEDLERACRAYAKASAAAMRLCQENRLPDPDPFSGVLRRPDAHPEFETFGLAGEAVTERATVCLQEGTTIKASEVVSPAIGADSFASIAKRFLIPAPRTSKMQALEAIRTTIGKKRPRTGGAV